MRVSAKIKMFPILASRWDLRTWNHIVPAPAGLLATAPVSSATDITSEDAKKSKHRPPISCCTHWKGAHSSRGTELRGQLSYDSEFPTAPPPSASSKQQTCNKTCRCDDFLFGDEMANTAGKRSKSQQDEWDGREPTKAQISFQPWEPAPFSSRNWCPSHTL